jgi:hypothetical protein
MNSPVNSLDDVAVRVGGSRLPVMYPGDIWDCELADVRDSEAAKSKYRRDWSELATQRRGRRGTN